MLELSNVEVSYGAVEAVLGIDLTVNDGEVLALIGPNGAGKTSTLNAISGLVPYRGSITFDGAECRKLGVQGSARRGLIQVPEGRRVFASLTVLENLLVGETARRGRETTYSIDDIFELFPALTALRDRDGWALSGGEQQMVAIGRALVASPRMLLLDEPSLGLAPTVVEAVFGALAQIRDRGVTILLVEQRARLTVAFADRTHVMANSEIRLTLGPADAADTARLAAAYLS